jgi:hypothetical protein
MSGSKIDWQNHLVAFIATFIGIIIAFELEDWNDSRKDQQAINVAIQSLRDELQADTMLMRRTLRYLPRFTGLNGAILKFRTGEWPEEGDATLRCTPAQFDSLKVLYPEGVTDAAVARRIGTTGVEFTAGWEGFIPERLRFDNWMAVKSSGLLYKFNHEQMTTFVSVYSFLERNYTGVSEDDIVKMQVESRTITPEQFRKTVNALKFSYEMSLTFIETDLEKISKY